MLLVQCIQLSSMHLSSYLSHVWWVLPLLLFVFARWLWLWWVLLLMLTHLPLRRTGLRRRLPLRRALLGPWLVLGLTRTERCRCVHRLRRMMRRGLLI